MFCIINTNFHLELSNLLHYSIWTENACTAVLSFYFNCNWFRIICVNICFVLWRNQKIILEKKGTVCFLNYIVFENEHFKVIIHKKYVTKITKSRNKVVPIIALSLFNDYLQKFNRNSSRFTNTFGMLQIIHKIFNNHFWSFIQFIIANCLILIKYLPLM